MYVKITLTLLVVLTAGLLAKVWRPAVIVEAPIPAPPGQADAALDRGMGAISLGDTTVEETVKELEKAANVKIDVNWDALKIVGISRADHVTISMDGGEFRDRIEAALTYGHTGIQLVCEEAGDTVTVTTIGSFAKGLTVRAYDVRDLLTDQYWAVKVAPPDVNDIHERRTEELASIVEDCVGSGSWDYDSRKGAKTGNGAVLRHWAGRLIVTQSARNHRKIERVLATLRQMQ
ncbi:MAG: hypothetical protein JWN51_1472 [Phycisphaerales bacterium]|nr:hypothetical protein [Phycisphaerales bacterium]